MSGAVAVSNLVPPKPTFPRAFGPYLLLDEMGTGGMGQVFLAKKPQMLGIDRYCVVKTLRAEHSDKSEYLGRFLDEARLAVHLNHKNICAVTDVGMHGDTLFMTMDLVVGRDLKTVQEKLTTVRRRLPDALALYVILEMLEALDYAHRLTDPVTNEPLALVHRDVSPANVLLSFEGEVKLIDFGLAESRLKTEHTKGEYVMGKLAYLSPEQAANEALDARTDQFAAAILAYELLTGERFYEGLIPEAIWKRAGTGEHEPRRMRELDPELSAVLRRALSLAPGDRFETCAAFRQAIDEVRLKRSLVASGEEARAFMAELFPDGLEQHRQRLADLVDAFDERTTDPNLLRRPISVEQLTRSASISFPIAVDSMPIDGLPNHRGSVDSGVVPTEPMDGLSAQNRLRQRATEQGLATLEHDHPLHRAMNQATRVPAELRVAGEDHGDPDRAEKTATVERRGSRRMGIWAAGSLAFAAGLATVLLLASEPSANPSPSEPTTAEARPAPAAIATAPEGGAANPPAAEATVEKSLAAAAPSRAEPAPDRPVAGPVKRRSRAAKATRSRTDVSSTGKAASKASGTGRSVPSRVAKKPGKPAPKTTKGKLDLLRSCSDPCARKVLRMSAHLDQLEIKQMRRYPALLDGCVETCR